VSRLRPLIIIIGLTPSQIPTYNGQCMSADVCVYFRMDTCSPAVSLKSPAFLACRLIKL